MMEAVRTGCLVYCLLPTLALLQQRVLKQVQACSKQKFTLEICCGTAGLTSAPQARAALQSWNRQHFKAGCQASWKIV